MHTWLAVAVLASLKVSVTANTCPNACSGHGLCKTQQMFGPQEGGWNVCECFQGWTMAADCSERDCVFEPSWGGPPNRNGNFHHFVECANRGVCDRTTGECMCFDGFTGRGCKYDECPNDCSGHGVCEFIEDFGYTLPPTTKRDASLSKREKTFETQMARSWEYHKVRACKCDPQWTDHDCSRRMCPRSNDIIHHRQDITDEPVEYQKQELVLIPGGPYGSGLNASMREFLDGSFSLVFVSLLNETYQTRPLQLDKHSFENVWNENWNKLGSAFAADIEDALLELPNRVIDDIEVQVTFNKTNSPNVLSFDLFERMIITFTMVGEANVGRQNLFAINAEQCEYPGCAPVLKGLNLVTFEGTGAPSFSQNLYSSVEETQVTDYNSYECGRRGQCDYSTGLCECFQGFTGPACTIMTDLS